MPSTNSITDGQTLYHRIRKRLNGVTVQTFAPVTVFKVDRTRRRVLATKEGGSPQWFNEKEVRLWRIKV